MVVVLVVVVVVVVGDALMWSRRTVCKFGKLRCWRLGAMQFHVKTKIHIPLDRNAPRHQKVPRDGNVPRQS